MATAPVEAIADAEAFGAYLEKSETILVVMDVHQNWCGPCDTMKPTYNSIFNEIDDCENKVAFTTADIKTLTPQLVELMATKPSDLELANAHTPPIVSEVSLYITWFLVWSLGRCWDFVSARRRRRGTSAASSFS